MTDKRSSEFLSTLDKGLRVLTCFTRDNPRMSLSEVARATDLNPAVARRCLLTLTELDYVGKTGSHFMLRPKVLALSTAFTESFDIDNLIRPTLQQLRSETGDSASFAVMNGSDILYVTHVSTYRVIRTQATTGTRFPALSTSLGRAILSTWSDGDIDAFLFEHPHKTTTRFTVTDPAKLKAAILHAREVGYAFVSDELDYGITSIATPIMLPGGGVIGAINISAATVKVDLSTFAENRLPLLETARTRLTEELQQADVLISAILEANSAP